MNQQPFLHPTDILLPDFKKTDGERWAVVACDQYTAEEAYWLETARLVGDAPSTLSLILPEVYLADAKLRIPQILQSMECLRPQLVCHAGAIVALERTQSDGKLRRGLVGAVDLEAYDYRAGADSLIRATEGTVPERIPPRAAVRRDATLESPHVMLLIDDPDRTVIEPAIHAVESLPVLYDFDLMQGGGHVKAHLLPADEQARVQDTLAALMTPEAMEKRYGLKNAPPLLFAVGDGNHSLATAKACYEELKVRIGAEAAAVHPARYALCEVVNLHDPALQFEPIYRVVTGVDVKSFLAELNAHLQALSGDAAPQTMLAVTADGEQILTAPHPAAQLCVGTLQAFLSDYCKAHPEAEVDYIHGEASLRNLVNRPDTVGFLFDGMRKDELFRTVICDGALPRKTFSMGHAPDKRYYVECREIK